MRKIKILFVCHGNICRSPMAEFAMKDMVKRKGLGREFVKFYEDYARENGCKVLRMDTNARNLKARAFYEKAGYIESGCAPCVFNGIPDVKLIMLEKKV